MVAIEPEQRDAGGATQPVTRDIADTMGAWWENRRNFIQPAEFVVGTNNKIIVSSYSDGPLGRIEGADVVSLIQFYEAPKGSMIERQCPA